ncbi:MAG: hypothetical protein ACFFC7_23890 [Candidatus Hermodarchaeota archaeon]
MHEELIFELPLLQLIDEVNLLVEIMVDEFRIILIVDPPLRGIRTFKIVTVDPSGLIYYGNNVITAQKS